MTTSSLGGLVPPILLDACVVLSLYASRRMEDILRANSGPFLVAEAVMREALYVHVIVDGVPERELVVLDPLVDSGRLAVIEPETDEEFLTLFDLVRELDDGEAMTCALALHRGNRIATDDKKTIKLMGQRIPIVGTLDLVRTWADAETTPPDLLRDVFLAIADRGYVPGKSHPHWEWWSQTLRESDR